MMKAIIETKRLYLRVLTPDDAIHFYNMNRNKNVIEFTGDDAFSSIEEAREFLVDYVKQYELYNMARWAVCLKSSHEVVGWCGLKYRPESKIVDVGYRFYEKYWNNGYATESTIAVLSYGFKTLQLKEIVAHAHKDNLASHRVLLKSGMKFVKDIIYDNQPAKFYKITA